MDKMLEIERRGAALKAEVIQYRKWFRTRAISLDLKRAAVAFVDDGVAFGMWPGHAAGLIGSTPATIEVWREAVARADAEATGSPRAMESVSAGGAAARARLERTKRSRDAARAKVTELMEALEERDMRIAMLEEALSGDGI